MLSNFFLFVYGLSVFALMIVAARIMLNGFFSGQSSDKKTAFSDIRQLLLDNKITDFADLFRLLYDEVDDWGKGHVAECILIIARYELSDGQVPDKEINAMAMLIELLGVIK